MDTILGIDVGSSKICAIYAKKDGNKVRILGVGSSKSHGIRKGIVSDIAKASNSIIEAIVAAKKISGTNHDLSVISVSGMCCKSIYSEGVVNIPDDSIGVTEIKRVMEMAKHNAQIPNEYKVLHILPMQFYIDENDYIDDPLGMSGSRLKVNVHIVIAQTSTLNNLKRAVNQSGIKIDNLVLNSYASTIATITEDEKELGTLVIDSGADTSNIAIYKKNVIKFADCLKVGSTNITSDLSVMLSIPLNVAENLKIQHGLNRHEPDRIVNLPGVGNNNETKSIPLEQVSVQTARRINETLNLLKRKFYESGFQNEVCGNIILTGGMAKLQGLSETTNAIFDNMNVRIGFPINIQGMSENLRDTKCSTAVGLVLYGIGRFTKYEMDANNMLKYDTAIKTTVEETQVQNDKTDIGQKIENSMNDLRLDKKQVLHETNQESFFMKLKKFITNLF